jgi:hypothetical protein
MSTSIEGSVKGKVAGAEAHGQVGDAEEGAQEVHQAALQVAERDAAVDHQPLHLVEHRAVRRVVVGAVGAAGRDDADRRRLGQHGADLQRAGLGAQHRPVAIGLRAGQVEGVVVLPRRWWSGMLSAPKLCQSLSMSGPSTTLKPIAPKIAVSSSTCG